MTSRGRKVKEAETHSRAYHRHFDGYVEYSALNPQGTGTRIERLYTAPWHRSGLSSRQFALCKAGCVASWIIGAALFVWAAARPCAANAAKAAGIFQGLVILAAVWAAKGLLFLLLAPGRMTIAEYRGSVGTLRTAAPLLAAAGTAELLYTAVADIWTGGRSGLPMLAALALSAGAWGALWAVQRRMRWRTEPNQNQDAPGIPICADREKTDLFGKG